MNADLSAQNLDSAHGVSVQSFSAWVNSPFFLHLITTKIETNRHDLNQKRLKSDNQIMMKSSHCSKQLSIYTVAYI